MQEAQFDPRTDVLERHQFARQLFGADLAAMSDSDLAMNCGGKSRCGYDFIFEMIGFYRTFGELLRQGPSGIEGPGGGWVKAPQEFHQRESALRELAEAADSFEQALRDYTGGFTSDVFPSPVGPFTPLGMANLAVWHTMYHSGQLNYIQTVRGDEAFHWMPEVS